MNDRLVALLALGVFGGCGTTPPTGDSVPDIDDGGADVELADADSDDDSSADVELADADSGDDGSPNVEGADTDSDDDGDAGGDTSEVTEDAPWGPDVDARACEGDSWEPDGGGLSDADDADGGERCPPDMAYVAAGPFVMGSDPGEGYCNPVTDECYEEPEHVVNVSAFCIDRTEVTNAAYGRCVCAGSCSPPIRIFSHSRPNYFADPDFDDHPVVFVFWDHAAAYCAWMGKRLPTEAEWEKAARGGCEVVSPEGCGEEDERRHPWGDSPVDCTLANGGQNDPTAEPCVPPGDTDRADSHAAGASPYGALNLAGNVAEWVADWFDPTYYGECASGCSDPTGPDNGTVRTLRNSGWEPPDDVAVTTRNGLGGTFDSVGFRCAASAP